MQKPYRHASVIIILVGFDVLHKTPLGSIIGNAAPRQTNHLPFFFFKIKNRMGRFCVKAFAYQMKVFILSYDKYKSLNTIKSMHRTFIIYETKTTYLGVHYHRSFNLIMSCVNIYNSKSES